MSALAGVVVGGVIEWWRTRSTFRREKGWELNEERRRRLEHLYEALEEVVEGYNLAYAEMIMILSSGQPPRLERPRPKIPWARLRMLVNLYAPELMSDLELVQRAGGKMGSALGEGVMNSSLDAVANQALANTLDTALGELTQAVNTMRDAIVEASRLLSASAAGATDTRLLSSR